MDTSTILVVLTLTKVIVCPFHLYGRTVHTFILIVGPFIVIERITFPIVYNSWLDSLEKRVFKVNVVVTSLLNTKRRDLVAHVCHFPQKLR